MKEDNIELIDYLRVIWKRKILIIVLTLAGVGVGVTVAVAVRNSKSKLPEAYLATVVVTIGQKVLFTPDSGISSVVVYIEPPVNLVETIPFKYGFKAREIPGYHLKVEHIGKLSMLKLTLQGPDKGIEETLNEIVDMLIADHRRMTKASIISFTGFIKKLEQDAIMFKKNIAVTEASIKEIRRRGGAHLESMVPSGAVRQAEMGHAGQSAFLNMLYLKTIDLERTLSENRKSLRNTQWQLIVYKTSMGERDKYNTEKKGKTMITTITAKYKSAKNTIIVAGVTGLIVSLVIVFFMEFIEQSKSKRKEK
tara:strand:+ start:37 stop:960 length:924 start_codon:yes stop_codon:yes gene_type:complete